MSTTAIVVDGLALVCLVIALVADRRRTKQALAAALKCFTRILPTVLLTIVLIGLLLGFVPPALVGRFVGERAGPLGVLAVAALITTLTMIGVVTLPLEIRELGRKMAVLRNGLSCFLRTGRRR